MAEKARLGFRLRLIRRLLDPRRYVDATGWVGPTYHRYIPEPVRGMASVFYCCQKCGYNEDRPWHVS